MHKSSPHHRKRIAGAQIREETNKGKKSTDLTMQTSTRSMDPRLKDIIAASTSFIIFLILLFALPIVIQPGIAYLIAVVSFIIVMSAAGYFTIEKIK